MFLARRCRRTCAITTQFQMPIPGSGMPSPPYVLPLFRLPLGTTRGSGGPTAVGIGSLTSRVPGSRCGEDASAACSLPMGLSSGIAEGNGARGRAFLCERPCLFFHEGNLDASSDGSTNQGRDEAARYCCGGGAVDRLWRAERVILRVLSCRVQLLNACMSRGRCSRSWSEEKCLSARRDLLILGIPTC